MPAPIIPAQLQPCPIAGNSRSNRFPVTVVSFMRHSLAWVCDSPRRLTTLTLQLACSSNAFVEEVEMGDWDGEPLDWPTGRWSSAQKLGSAGTRSPRSLPAAVLDPATGRASFRERSLRHQIVPCRPFQNACGL